MAESRERDPISGTDTTGHEWDGIKELNTPLPRWWVWTFWATIVWSIGYWIAMPAWPLLTSYTTGLLGYSERGALEKDIARARAAQAVHVERLRAAPLESIRATPDLLEFALAGGRSAFAVNCSQCHGAGAAGGAGYPDLNDDDWLWGGTLEAILRTVRFGVRSGHAEARTNDMPAFLRDGILSREQVNDAAEFVLSLSGRASDQAAAERGKEIFAEQCVACHGERGTGNIELGAPHLGDAIWLYGGDKASVVRSISQSRRGVMPAWDGRLDEATLRQLAVFVHSLGGGT